MNSPDPLPPNGWRPTQSTVGGALLGAAISQVIIAFAETYWGYEISSQTSGAITTICVAAAGYFFPDGGRK